MTKQVRQAITPTHILGSTGTAESDTLGYRPLADFKNDLGLGSNLTNTTVAGTLAVTGGQIAFPATAVPSANANTLDDYEEGTWTPVIAAQTVGDLSVSYDLQNGVYTKVGNLVTVTGSITTSAFTHTTASGNFTISGLPFTSTATVVQPTASVGYSGYTKADFPQLVLAVPQNDTVLLGYSSGSAQTRVVTSITDFPTGGTVSLTFSSTYYV